MKITPAKIIDEINNKRYNKRLPNFIVPVVRAAVAAWIGRIAYVRRIRCVCSLAHFFDSGNRRRLWAMERFDFAYCVLELESLEHCLVKIEWTSKIREYYDKALAKKNRCKLLHGQRGCSKRQNQRYSVSLFIKAYLRPRDQKSSSTHVLNWWKTRWISAVISEHTAS